MGDTKLFFLMFSLPMELNKHLRALTLPFLIKSNYPDYEADTQRLWGFTTSQ